MSEGESSGLSFAKLAFTLIIFYSVAGALALISIVLKIIDVTVHSSSPLAISRHIWPPVPDVKV